MIPSTQRRARVELGEVTYTVGYVWHAELGRFAVFDLTIETVCTEITGAMLRSVRLEDVYRRALEVHRHALRSHFATSYGDGTIETGSLEDVAVIYRTAFALHEPPVEAVSTALGLPLSTASKRVIAARHAGLLSPTTRGKAAP